MEFFRKTLDPIIALAAIAVLDIFLFLVVGAWTVGGGETMMTGLLAQAVLGDDLQRIPFWNIVFPPHADYWKIYISLGMFFGAFVGAVLSKEFYWRLPRRASEWLMITIGGLLMGIGIRMAYICNVSTFFGLLPEMNLGGYLAISGYLRGDRRVRKLATLGGTCTWGWMALMMGWIGITPVSTSLLSGISVCLAIDYVRLAAGEG